MFNFFSKIKSTSLVVLNIVINISTLIYLVTLHGFGHINKELMINTFTGISIVAILITIVALIMALIIYISFKVAYKKILEHIENNPLININTK